LGNPRLQTSGAKGDVGNTQSHPKKGNYASFQKRQGKTVPERGGAYMWGGLGKQSNDGRTSLAKGTQKAGGGGGGGGNSTI